MVFDNFSDYFLCINIKQLPFHESSIFDLRRKNLIFWPAFIFNIFN